MNRTPNSISIILTGISISVEESRVIETASFVNDLGADSLDLYELVMALEEEYEVEIPTDDLEGMNTVGDVLKILEATGAK